MSATHSKSAFLYTQVRRALQSGSYAPGQRIDPATLARHFKTSATPVRFALYRLVGEGMVADHARAGLHVPLLTEVAMRDLYDWMLRLLLMACDLVATPSPRQATRGESIVDPDVVKLTWKLFDAIAESTAHRALHQAVRRANDQLAPIRRAKQPLLESTFTEFDALNQLWKAREIPALKAALGAYHERRKELVPRIVASLSDHRELLR